MINSVGSYTAVSGGFQLAMQDKTTASVRPTEAVVAVSHKPDDVILTEQGQQEARSIDPDTVRNAVSQLNDYVQNIRRTLSFSVDESTGRTVIRVYDSETRELIREIPPEVTLRIAAQLDVRLTASMDGLFLAGQQV